MRDLPLSARVYIYLIFGLGAFAALASFLAVTTDPGLILVTIGLAALIAIFDLIPVNFPGHDTEILPSTAIKLAAVLLVPPPVLLLATFVGTSISEWRLKRVWYKLLFNTGALTVTYTVVVYLYAVVHEPQLGILGSPANIIALVLVGIGDVTVNSVIISMVVALVARQRIEQVLANNAKPILLHELSMLPIGVFLAMLWEKTPLGIVLGIAPLMLARKAYQMVVDLEWQTREALMALARVLDERDQSTGRHCELVALNAELIARELGISDADVDEVSRSAWLHDIGKVGMRNEVLFKPGALSGEEWEHAKRHAAIGGDLLQKFPLFKKGSGYVRHHHEWYNGSGYPDKLAGEAIPLGARILSVSDAYEAMLDERPYRKPMSEDAALEQLRRGAGTQFDPKVVAAFFHAKGREMYPLETESLLPVPEQVGVAAE